MHTVTHFYKYVIVLISIKAISYNFYIITYILFYNIHEACVKAH